MAASIRLRLNKIKVEVFKMDTEFYAIMYQALGTTAGAAIGYLIAIAFAYKFIKEKLAKK